MKTTSGRTRCVAIVGSGPSRKDAPWDDPVWEFWGLGSFWRWMPRWDRWFEMHQLAESSTEEIRALKNIIKTPIFMPRKYPAIPRSVRYPIERIAAGHSRMFTCTFCYELALAIYEGVGRIGLWGVDLDHASDSPREATVERMGVAYWVGVARGRGIPVAIGGTVLTHSFLYGIQYWAEVRNTRQFLASLKYRLRTVRDDFDIQRRATRIPARARRIAARIP